MGNTSEFVEGEIVFREIISPFSDVTGYVFLEDVSRADAPSQEIARTVIRGIAQDRDHSCPVPFRIVHPSLGKYERYIISVLIDVDGDGRISRGDYITMESFPVVPHHHERLRIYVQRVA
jgi:uncharacterized lipoprotein YbaY